MQANGYKNIHQTQLTLKHHLHFKKMLYRECTFYVLEVAEVFKSKTLYAYRNVAFFHADFNVIKIKFDNLYKNSFTLGVYLRIRVRLSCVTGHHKAATFLIYKYVNMLARKTRQYMYECPCRVNGQSFSG